MRQALIAATFFGLMGCAALAQDSTPGGNTPSTPQAQNPSAAQPAGNPTPSSQPQTAEPQTTRPQTSEQSTRQIPQAQTAPAATAPAAAAPAANSSASGSPIHLAPGSVFPAELVKTVDAKKIKSGDEVVAQIMEDLKSGSGDVIFAKGTKIIGSVTAAQARNKEQKESELTIAFTKAVMKGGSELQVPLSIQAIVAPQGANSGNSNSENDQPSTAAGGMTTGAPGSAGRATMGGSASPTPTPNATGTDASASPASSSSGARGPITASTQGVIGIPNLKLAAAQPSPSQGSSSAQGSSSPSQGPSSPQAAQGSMISSDKSNVRLESGTMLLLRVNQ